MFSILHRLYTCGSWGRRRGKGKVLSFSAIPDVWECACTVEHPKICSQRTRSTFIPLGRHGLSHPSFPTKDIHGQNDCIKNVSERAVACIRKTFTIKFFRFFRRYTKKLDRFSVFFSLGRSRRRSLMAKLQPSKLVLSVRFRPPAPAEHRRLSGFTIGMEVVGMRFFLSIWVKNGLTSGYERFPIETVVCV